MMLWVIFFIDFFLVFNNCNMGWWNWGRIWKLALYHCSYGWLWKCCKVTIFLCISWRKKNFAKFRSNPSESDEIEFCKFMYLFYNGPLEICYLGRLLFDFIYCLYTFSFNWICFYFFILIFVNKFTLFLFLTIY